MSEKLWALVVDDNKDVLGARVQYFESRGFRALGAQSKEDALRQVKNTPALDIVVTDVDLRGDDRRRPDNEGEILASEIRKFRTDVPIVAYTARNDKDYLERVNWDVFTETLSKGGGLDEIERDCDICLELASRHKRRRIEVAKLELQRLQGKYEIPDYDIATLRAFLPAITNRSSETNEVTESESESAEELLQRAGYRLHFIEAGAPVEGPEEQPIVSVLPVPVWIRHEADCYVAELYGHSCIYADGPTEAAAVAAIASLMYGYLKDFEADPERPLSADLEHLRDDLHKFFH